MELANSLRLLRRLGGLGRQLYSAQCTVTESVRSGAIDLAVPRFPNGKAVVAQATTALVLQDAAYLFS